MKLSKRDTNLLLVLVGLIVFLGAYLGIANRYNARAEELQVQIAELAPRLEELRAHSANLPVYEAGIEQSIANVEAELSRYPASRPGGAGDRQRELLADGGGLPLPDRSGKCAGRGRIRPHGCHENRLFHQL